MTIVNINLLVFSDSPEIVEAVLSAEGVKNVKDMSGRWFFTNHQHDFPHQHPVVAIVMFVQVPRPACWGARQGESGSKAVGFTQGLSWVGCSRVPQLTWFTRGSVGCLRWMLSTCKGKHSCVRNVLHLWFVLQIYQINLLPFSVDCCKFQLVF